MSFAAGEARGIPGSEPLCVLWIAPGRTATAIATCTTISAVQVRPSCIPAPREENCCRPRLHPPARRLQGGQHADARGPRGRRAPRRRRSPAGRVSAEGPNQNGARSAMSGVLQDLAKHAEGDGDDGEADRPRSATGRAPPRKLRDDTSAARARAPFARRSHPSRRRARVDENRDVHRDDQQQQADAELEGAHASSSLGTRAADESPACRGPARGQTLPAAWSTASSARACASENPSASRPNT